MVVIQVKVLLICQICFHTFPQDTPLIFYETEPDLDTEDPEKEKINYYFPVPVHCPHCDEDISHGKFQLTSDFFWDRIGDLFSIVIEGINTNPNLVFITPQMKNSITDQLISYPSKNHVLINSISPVKKVRLQKKVKVNKSSSVHQLVHKLTIVDRRKKKFKDDFGRMERGLRPILAKIEEKGVEAVPSLIAYLYHFNTWSCIFAARVLGKIKDNRAIEPLIDALEVPFADYLNEEALLSLSQLGSPAIDPLIKRITARLKEPSQDEYGDKLGTIFLIGALSHIKSPKVYEFMQNLLINRKKWINLDLAHLCSCFVEQENPAIISYLKEISTEYEDTGIGKEAHYAYTELKKLEKKKEKE